MKGTKSKPRWSHGTKVLYSGPGPDIQVLRVNGQPTHNGFAWMYAFDGTDLRCGEAYLTHVDQSVSLGKLKVRRVLTFEESKKSPHREHVITQEEAQKLADYFNDLDTVEDWTAEFFAGKTVAQAGTDSDYGAGYADECTQQIICELFNYEGEY